MAKKDKVIESKWVKIESKLAPRDNDYITVSFSGEARKNGRYCYIKLDSNVLDKMRWNIDDNVSVFHQEDDVYSWMICKTTKGRRLSKNSKSKSALVSMIWDKNPIPFTKARQVEFNLYKDRIELKVK